MEDKEKIIFGGETTKEGITTQAYQQVGAAAATHLKVVGENKFIEITDSLIIRKIKSKGDKRGSSGSEGADNVHYSDVVPGGAYECVIGEESYRIEPVLYSQIAFMKKAKENEGTHFRCDDGVYIRADEVQVPAYKKIETSVIHSLTMGTVHNNRHYVRYATIIIDGKKLNVPINEVVERNGKTYYKQKDLEVECEYIKDSEHNKYIDNILVDGDKIVDVKKLKLKENGEYVVEVGKEEVLVGQTNIDIKGSFMEGAAVSTHEMILNSDNIEAQRSILDTNSELTFNWYHPKKGKAKVIVSQTNRYALIEYVSGAYDVIVEQNAKVSEAKIRKILAERQTKNKGNNYKFTVVDKFELEDLGDRGVRFSYPAMSQKELATNVVVKNDKIVECTLNGRDVKNIEWSQDIDFPRIVAYEMDGVKISDIKWDGAKIETCTLTIKNEDNTTRTIANCNIEKSNYRDFAIRHNKNLSIKDFKIDDKSKTISFKIGDFTITEAEYDFNQGTIGKCKIAKAGESEIREVDLREDPRFKHLRLAIEVTLDQSRVQPLIRSKLLEKKDGKYEKVADVVQTSEVGKDGIASASGLTSAEQAVKAQQKFTKNPYPTWVMDERGDIHQLEDVNTMYAGISSFKCEDNLFSSIVGKDKVEAKNGDITIDAKESNNKRDNSIFVGLALCSNFLTMPIGICILTAGVVRAIAAPIRRAIKKDKIKKISFKSAAKMVRENQKQKCQENVREIEREITERLRYAEKNNSSADLVKIREELKLEYMQRMSAEAASMQIFGQGALDCEFDLSKKTKLTQANMLAWYACQDKRRQLIKGKDAHPKFESEWNKLFESKQGKDEAKAVEGKESRHGEKLPQDLIEAVKVLQTYGGRKEQIKAHEIIMNNLDLFLEEENRYISDPNRKFDKETFMRDRINAFNAGKLEWGSIEDKIEVLKQGEAYYVATPKKRHEMVEERRKELMKEADNAKITKIEMEAEYDKSGNSLADVNSSIIMTRAQYGLEELFNGTTKKLPPFNINHPQKLSSAEREAYSGKITDNVCTRISKSDNRQLMHDNKTANDGYEKLAARQDELDNKVGALQGRADIVAASKDRERAYILRIEAKRDEQEFDNNCKEQERLIKKVPNGELIESSSKQASDRLNDTQVARKVASKKCDEATKENDNKYKMQIESWAYNDYISQHSDEFKYFLSQEPSDLDKNDEEINKYLKAKFVKYMQTMEGSKEVVTAEIAALRVKHNLEESVVAEEYCEQDKEEFEKYARDRIDLNTASDEEKQNIMCAFYAESKRKDPVAIDKFKKDNQDKIDNRAVKRLEEGKLQEHKGKESNLKLEKGSLKKKGAEAKTSEQKEELQVNDHEEVFSA